MKTDSKTLRQIAGLCTYQATIVGGTGDFNIHKITTGQYRLTWHKPFRSPPIVAIAPTGASIIGYNADALGSNIYTYNAGGAVSDQSFAFTATGVPHVL